MTPDDCVWLLDCCVLLLLLAFAVVVALLFCTTLMTHRFLQPDTIVTELFCSVVASASAVWWVALMLPPICVCSASSPQPLPLPPPAVWFCVLS